MFWIICVFFGIALSQSAGIPVSYSLKGIYASGDTACNQSPKMFSIAPKIGIKEDKLEFRCKKIENTDKTFYFSSVQVENTLPALLTQLKPNSVYAMATIYEDNACTLKQGSITVGLLVGECLPTDRNLPLFPDGAVFVLVSCVSDGCRFDFFSDEQCSQPAPEQQSVPVLTSIDPLCRQTKSGKFAKGRPFTVGPNRQFDQSVDLITVTDLSLDVYSKIIEDYDSDNCENGNVAAHRIFKTVHIGPGCSPLQIPQCSKSESISGKSQKIYCRTLDKNIDIESQLRNQGPNSYITRMKYSTQNCHDTDVTDSESFIYYKDFVGMTCINVSPFLSASVKIVENKVYLQYYQGPCSKDSLPPSLPQVFEHGSCYQDTATTGSVKCIGEIN
jgi:hypothetical protein